MLDVPFLEAMPTSQEIDSSYLVVLDAIFGFSFKGDVRAPFDGVLATLQRCTTPICSVDIPSGAYNAVLMLSFLSKVPILLIPSSGKLGGKV